jgi:NADH:ubiquinone oxidoreductase subunit 5 (subunit L)/multisubunit Na+/H+ antiporter MnhA subunit
MTEALHPAASHHLPSFITAPGETDVLMVVMAVVLVVAVLMFGVLFLTLHTLPERIAHKAHKLQFEIVAVLGLLALFTHMHIFWVIGLLLALIDIPDFGGWLSRIAGSVEKIATNKSDESGPQEPRKDIASIKTNDGAATTPREDIASIIRRGDGTAAIGPVLTQAGKRG